MNHSGPESDARGERAFDEGEQFRVLIQSVHDYAIFMLDADGYVASWNPGAERIKGYRAGEIIGQHFSRFYTEEDRANGEPARALPVLRRALHLNPSMRDPREALIATLLDGGRFDEIVTEAKALVKVAPRSVFARDVLSIAYMQLGKVEKALRIVGELVWLDPLNPDHYLKRAMLFQQQDNTRAAVAEYARVLHMAPEESEAYECAEEAIEMMDEDQLRQIVLLASEDRLFHWKLCRETAEAAQERGFFLSPDGVARLRHIAQSHLPDLERDLASYTTWGRPRLYN